MIDLRSSFLVSTFGGPGQSWGSHFVAAPKITKSKVGQASTVDLIQEWKEFSEKNKETPNPAIKALRERLVEPRMEKYIGTTRKLIPLQEELSCHPCR